MSVNAYVETTGKFEKDFRDFKRQVGRSKVLEVVREKMHYNKPAQVKQMRRKDARRRLRLAQRANELPARLY